MIIDFTLNEKDVKIFVITSLKKIWCKIIFPYKYVILFG